MAKKPAAGAKAARDPAQVLIDAALELAALQGWQNTSLREIALQADVPPAEARAVFPSKMALLSALFARTDQAMLADAEPGTEEPVRDRLFDIVMCRFDALAPHKAGLRAILKDLPRDPAVALCLARGPMRRSLEWMLEGAGVDSWGPLRPLQIKGLGVIYLVALRAWLKDESEDLSATMAALDKALDRADQMVGRLSRRRRRPSRDEGETADESADK